MHEISESALVKRVNRRLSGTRVRTCPKGSKDIWDLGRYFLVSDRNFVEDKDVDLEAIASELGALKPSERLAETSG